MTNSLREADIVRQQEVALQRKEHRLAEHKKRHSEHQKAAYKDMLVTTPAVNQKPTLVAWVLYDATTNVKYIKMDPADGSLAIFDSEESAMAAKKQNYGTDYERCEYYSAPQPVRRQQVRFCEDTALSLAERTFSTEVDERLAEDVIQYAQRLYDLYTAPHPIPEVAKLVEALEGLLAIVSESSGVVGYHLNGEIAEWCEFEEVESAEEALASYRQQVGDV